MEEEHESDEENAVVLAAAVDENDCEDDGAQEMDEINDGNNGEDGSGGAGGEVVEVIDDTQDDPPSPDLFTPEDKALPLEPATTPKPPAKTKIQVFGTASSSSSRLAHAQVRIVD